MLRPDIPGAESGFSILEGGQLSNLVEPIGKGKNAGDLTDASKRHPAGSLGESFRSTPARLGAAAD